MTKEPIMARLLASEEPSIRFKVRVHVLGESPKSRSIRSLREEIRRSERVARLLAGRDQQGRLRPAANVYAKWQGAHWVFAALADLGYPQGDRELLPIRDQLMDAWLSDFFYAEFASTSKAQSYGGHGIPKMAGRYRAHASQQGCALLSVLQLGLADSRAERLVERLLHWQWPDGGWNCDREPGAARSSFMETLLPMRALDLFARAHVHRGPRVAADRAAEIFLARKLYKRRRDDTVIRSEFTKLHYPLYWHYDILAGLKAMAELGKLDDPRCGDALDLLAAKRLPDGGWPAEARYYKVSAKTIKLGADRVDWGGTSTRRMNEWVTADALYVLKAAGRW